MDDAFAKAPPMIGDSPAFRDSVALIRRAAACDVTVLIQGETGTGKELAARAIHYLGSRRNAPFVPVNCGAIPDSLVESELFGHVRGAFTDARESRTGLIAQAEGGTLFLDEVEAMSPRTQVALLRVLQDREYRPVGAAAFRGADVRVLAASNLDLAALVERREFRSDLLFRLNVLTVDLPPVRARGDDVLLLADAFLERYCREYGLPPRALHPDAATWLLAQPWPGNVRELENLVQRHVLLGEGPWVDPRPAHARAPAVAPASGTAALPPFSEAKARAIESFERSYIIELLSCTRGNLSLAARLSGKERSRLGRLLKKYGLARSQFCQH